jgi:hypothetical protein
VKKRDCTNCDYQFLPMHTDEDGNFRCSNPVAVCLPENREGWCPMGCLFVWHEVMA